MHEYANARIVSCNMHGERVSACAARISTTPGNAFELFNAASDSAANQKLIGKVLSSGHSSVIEHAVFSLAMTNVSVYVEQFFIEHRLASFTVKSRRYVDFAGQGYYIPPELNSDEREAYCTYMDALFAAYKELLECGVAREDARFILPYSLCSSFYCTVNARELVHIIAEMKSGRGSAVPELRELARQLEAQLQEQFPAVAGYIAVAERAGGEYTAPEKEKLGELRLVSAAEAGGVELLSAPANPEGLVNAASALMGRDGVASTGLIKTARPRELELLNYAYVVHGLTLSGITHLARHRMQSLIVPSLDTLTPAHVIVPDSVRENAEAEKIYLAAVHRAYDELKAHEGDALYTDYRRYFALCGTLADVISSMNARELLLFFELRCCERAQWEIRAVATGLLKLLRENYPALFNAMGPSCVVKGYCPEGRLGCGRAEEIKSRFNAL